MCLFVGTDRQQEKLGDFEELFNTVWLPKFGVRLAKLIYLWHALRSGVAIIRIDAVAAFADRVWGILRR